MVPSFVLHDSLLVSKLTAFVEQGGTVVATARTAIRDRRNQALAQTPPGGLAHVFGASVEEFGRLEPQAPLSISGDRQIPHGGAYEVLKPSGAQVIATWSVSDGTSWAAHDQPAITLNLFQTGRALLVGTYLTGDNIGSIFDLVLAHSSVAPLGNADEYVEIGYRFAEGRNLCFVLNHYGKTKSVSRLPQGVDLITGQACTGQLELPPYGAAVIDAV